jgi:hypothetical protein
MIADPHRQGSPRNDDIISEAHASLQGGGCNKVDG